MRGELVIKNNQDDSIGNAIVPSIIYWDTLMGSKLTLNNN